MEYDLALSLIDARTFTILFPLVCSVRSGCGRPGFDPRPRHTKDVKNGRFALHSLALGINELGNRLGGSESV